MIARRALARRRAGGKLAIGRDSATYAELQVERAVVAARADGGCEIGMQLQSPCGNYGPLRGTDFAHVIPRSQGGRDDRDNALWLCRPHHRMMEAPYAKGRLLVRRITLRGVQGFDWEVVVATGKHAFRLGQFTTLAGGFIPARGHALAAGTVAAEPM